MEIDNSSFTNSPPGSEKNCTSLAEAVGRHNGKLTFGGDAHIAVNVGHFTECVAVVERIGLPADRILSTSCRNFLTFLQDKGKRNLKILT